MPNWCLCASFLVCYKPWSYKLYHVLVILERSIGRFCCKSGLIYGFCLFPPFIRCNFIGAWKRLLWFYTNERGWDYPDECFTSSAAKAAVIASFKEFAFDKRTWVLISCLRPNVKAWVSSSLVALGRLTTIFSKSLIYAKTVECYFNVLRRSRAYRASSIKPNYFNNSVFNST